MIQIRTLIISPHFTEKTIFTIRSCLQLSKNLRIISTRSMSKKTALVLLAEGAEEMEFTISVDILRRAGVDVTVAGVDGLGTVKCSRGVYICPDTSLRDAINANSVYSVVLLPGGLGGSKKLSDSTEVGNILKKQEETGGIIAAICAAPTALLAHKIALGKTITSYPSVKDKLVEGNVYNYSEDRVVVDGNLITSRGPGTAFDFALTIAEILTDKETKDKVAAGMLYR